MRPRFLALACLVFFACSREEKRPERTAPWRAPSAAASRTTTPVVGRVRYELEKSDLGFELPGRDVTPRGRLPAATGQFEIDLDDLEHASGSVRIDVSRLELDGSDASERSDRTRRALEWLELGSEVAAATREAHRYATFALKRIEGATLGRPRRDAKLAALDLVAFGELSLHGVRAPLSVPVRLEIEPSADPRRPGRLVIRLRKPLVVTLSVHDIRPRDARGVVVARELDPGRKKFGREAKVSFELTLAPRP